MRISRTTLTYFGFLGFDFRRIRSAVVFVTCVASQMARSTDAQKAKRLNVAHRLLARGTELADAATALARDFGLSRRQAYRYLEEAEAIGHPVPITEPSVPITLKIPGSVVRDLRNYSGRQRTNTWRDCSACHLGLLEGDAQAWLNAKGGTTARFVLTMRSIVCSSAKFSRSTRFWFRTEYVWSVIVLP